MVHMQDWAISPVPTSVFIKLPLQQTERNLECDLLPGLWAARFKAPAREWTCSWPESQSCHQLPHSRSQSSDLAFYTSQSRAEWFQLGKVFLKTTGYHTHEKLDTVLRTLLPASLCSKSFLNMRFPGNGMLLIGWSPRARDPLQSNSVSKCIHSQDEMILGS